MECFNDVYLSRRWNEKWNKERGRNTKTCLIHYNKWMGGTDLKDQQLKMYLVEGKLSQVVYEVIRRFFNVTVLNAMIMWRNSPLLVNGSLKARFIATNTLVEINALPRDWHTFRSNGWNIITDEEFEVVVSLRCTPSYKREFSREFIDSFVREFSVQLWSVHRRSREAEEETDS
jgi:hypothetical protein